MVAWRRHSLGSVSEENWGCLWLHLWWNVIKMHRETPWHCDEVVLILTQFLDVTCPEILQMHFWHAIPSSKLTWLWKITMFHRYINYKWPGSIAMLNYQRVNSFLLGHQEDSAALHPAPKSLRTVQCCCGRLPQTTKKAPSKCERRKKIFDSMDWLKGKSTGNHIFSH